MTEVSSLTFRNNIVESVTFKGNTVEGLNFNGLHWGPDARLFLNSWLVGSDTGSQGATNNLHPVSGETEQIETAGGVVLALIVEKSPSDSIVLTGEGNNRLGYKVEDWGFIITAKMGGWSGGTEQIAYKQFEIHSATDPTIKKQFRKGSRYDENNTVLFYGLYTSKTFRIPSSGGNILSMVENFPYTFYSFPNPLTIGNIGVFNPFNHTVTAYSDCQQDIIDSISISDINDIRHVLDVNFKANTTGQYRFISLLINDANDRITMNFIQEYSSNYRVYFNGSYYYSDYMYSDPDEQADIYKYLFTLSDSAVISDGMKIVTEIMTYVCLPQTLLNEYNVTYSVENTNAHNVTRWDGISYDVQYFTRQTELTFNRK